MDAVIRVVGLNPSQNLLDRLPAPCDANSLAKEPMNRQCPGVWRHPVRIDTHQTHRRPTPSLLVVSDGRENLAAVLTAAGASKGNLLRAASPAPTPSVPMFVLGSTPLLCGLFDALVDWSAVLAYLESQINFK